MIRVFNVTDKLYESNGDIVIQPTKARVHNSDNGEYYLELVCSADYNDFVKANNIIVAPTPNGAQAFRIREITKNKNRLEVKAPHVFYDADNYVIADSYAVQMSCMDALNHFNDATDNTSPFTMFSDIMDLRSFRCVRKSLTECINTVIERWGGHLKRDNWDISILSHTGQDNGITIEYKKNLKELTATYDWSGVVTKILPVGKDGILLDELYLYSEKQYDIPFTQSISFEQDIDEEDYPNEAAYKRALKEDLKKQAENYLAVYSVPIVNYELKGNPEKVTDIGDTIEVKDERIGVDVLTEVISYEYDAIMERYVELEFGNFTNTLSDLIPQISKEASNIASSIAGEITTDTSRIYKLLQDGEVVFRGYDLLVLDNLPINSAVNVLKLNENGVSISNEGVNGAFYTIYDLMNKRLRVNNHNSIGLYDTENNLIGSIDTSGVNILGDFLRVDGSLVKYLSDEVIYNKADFSTTCIVDSDTFTFDIDVDKLTDGVSIYNLELTIYDGIPTTATIVTDGVIETGDTLTVTKINDLKYRVEVGAALNVSDGAYIIKYNIELKAV